MKYFLTAACLLIVLMSKAQIVNIPDSNFKNFLLNYDPAIDINHDGEIQQTEASAVTQLDIESQTSTPPTLWQIHDITGIQSFTNLLKLYCHAGIRQLQLNIPNRLRNIEISCDSLTAVNFSGCANLDTFYISARLLTSLDISACNKLTNFTCHAWLQSLVLGTQDSLKIINIQSFLMDTLDLRPCKNLQYLWLQFNNNKMVNCSGLRKLSNFNQAGLGDEQSYEIDLTGCSGLVSFVSGMSSLRTVSVAGCTALERFQMGSPNGIVSLDFSTCPNLHNLLLPADRLKNLNLKNGSVLTTFSISRLSADTLNICADEFELDELNSTYEYDIRNISPYCSFFPGGNYNTIKGKFSIDADNNGCDGSDRGMENVAVKITDSSGNTQIRYSASSGAYGYYPYKGTFTLNPYFAYPWFVVTPAAASVTFDTANSLTNMSNFCIRPNGIHNDLEITILPNWPPARPGFDAGYILTYKNRGTTTLSGNVQVNFDNSKMNFVAASQNVTTQSTGQLLWNYNNLQPFESSTIYVTFNLLPPPVNNIGDTITYFASITPSANDETAFDNSFILPQRIRGSFDPNEKQCLEGSKIDISKIGEYLHYQIHFQNEGTDTAFNIVIADTLSDKLDWNTLELMNSSHPCAVNIKNNKAEFIFENIKLPYKTINESASNGYIAFKIKPKPSVVIGDSMNNTAAIYFDFNMPVITNRVTTVVTSTSTPVPVKVEYFSINNRNNINTLNWKAACTNGSANFSIERSGDGIHFSSIGSITATYVRCQLPFNFNDNNPVSGKNYYRLKITDADGVSLYSKTLVIGNNKAGLEITVIANGDIYLHSNKQQTLQIKIIASDGKEVWNEKQIITAGRNSIRPQMKNTATGMYTLIVYTNDGETIIKKYIK